MLSYSTAKIGVPLTKPLQHSYRERERALETVEEISHDSGKELHSISDPGC